MTKKKGSGGVWFPDGPRLSQVDTISGLTDAPSEQPYNMNDEKSLSINKTFTCDCKQFILQRIVSYGTSLLDKAEYCECGHTRFTHFRKKGKCNKQWIEKNLNRKSY